MKRLYIFLLMFLLLGTFAFADDEVTLEGRGIYLSGSAELSWGISGQLMDNSAMFIGEVQDKDLFASGDDVAWPYEWTLSLAAANEDGDVIVAAEGSIEIGGGTLVPDDGEQAVAYEFIEFNVLPGMVLLRLLPDDVVSTDVTAGESESSSPTIELVATPMDGLEAKLALVWDNHQGDRLNARYFTGVDPFALAGSLAGLTAMDVSLDNLLEAVDDAATTSEDWVIGNFSTVAAAFQVEYTLAVGEMDSVVVTAGLVFDTAYSNHVFVGSEKLDDADAPTVIYFEETTGAKQAKNFDLDFQDADDVEKFRKDLQKGFVYGYATLPIGVQVELDMMGISATAAFQARMVQGWDIYNPDKGKYDLGLVEDGLDPFDAGSYADPDDFEVGKPQAYAMPMYASVDVGYEMDMSGMTIEPSANFQFSSDFYKIGWNDDDAVEYMGDVAAAQFLGRQMSASLGVDVNGIADMLDVSLSAAMGFGFGDGLYDWPFDDAYNAVMWPGDITGVITDLNKIHTDEEKADKDADVDEWMSNGLAFAEDFNVMSITLGISAEPIENLSLSNDFTYTSDGMGLAGANDLEMNPDLINAANTGLWLDMIENATSVEYGIAVAGTVAATLYADVTYTKWNYAGEEGVYAKGWDSDLGLYNRWDSEQSTKATLDYEVGVKVSVDF